MSWEIIIFLLLSQYVIINAQTTEVTSHSQLVRNKNDDSDAHWTAQEAILIQIQLKLPKLSTLDRVIRIATVSTLTVLGIVATILFSKNILNSSQANQSRLRDSNIQASSISHVNKLNEKKLNGSMISDPILSQPEKAEKGEEKSTDFPTLSISASRSSAGQDDIDLSSSRKFHPRWDDIEMLRHGFIGRNCTRISFPEINSLPVTNNNVTYGDGSLPLKKSGESPKNESKSSEEAGEMASNLTFDAFHPTTHKWHESRGSV